MFSVLVANIPELLIGGVYTYTVYKIGRWSTTKWPRKNR